MKTAVSLDNPYLELFKAQMRRHEDYWSVNHTHARGNYVKQFAWAIPNDEALLTITKYGPVVEIGAGTGYWAKLLDAIGVDVVAYDIAPPDAVENYYHERCGVHFPVQKGDTQSAANHQDRTLFLCWPPYDSSMAFQALKAYQGEYLVYVGEGYGGCTGNDEFHDLLDQAWDEVESVSLPQWPGIHDMLYVYRRKH